MSGDADGARRAFTALSQPASRLRADFEAAERLAELEPELLLLDLDVFGGLTVPKRHAEVDRDRRRRRPSAAGLPPAVRRDQTAPPAAASRPGGSEAVAHRDQEQPGLRSEAPAQTSGGREGSSLPVLPLRTTTVLRPGEHAASVVRPHAPGRSAPSQPPDVPAVIESQGSGGEPLAPATQSPSGTRAETSGETVRVETTLELLAQLADSILARAGPTASPGPRAGQPPPAVAQHADGSFATPSLEAEVLQSLPRGLGEPALAPNGLQPPQLPADADAAREHPRVPAFGASVSALPGPAAAPDGARRPPDDVAVAAPDREHADPSALAASVNDALIEQARRHGLELG
jgi:hypothetical protein